MLCLTMARSFDLSEKFETAGMRRTITFVAGPHMQREDLSHQLYSLKAFERAQPAKQEHQGS